MLTVLAILLFAGLIAMAFALALEVGVDFDAAGVMPLSCPQCHGGTEEDSWGRTRWYRPQVGGVYCRHCGTSFRESANGTLVKDPDF